MTDLDRAIESLYETFAVHSQPETVRGCPCCTKREETAHLVTGPLRTLRFPDLADYSFSAMTTQGSVDDFRYFLPRLLQGIAKEPYSYNPEILFGKLRYAKWMEWRPNEIAAVRDYLNALWLEGLTSFPLEERLPAFFEIETLLASIAQTGEALEPYLQTWTDTITKEVNEHLIQFVTIYGAEFSDGGTLREAFWAASKPQAVALREWLLRPDTLQRVKSCIHLLRNDGFEHLFEPSLKVLLSQSSSRH